MQYRGNVSLLIIAIALLFGWPHSSTIAAGAASVPVDVSNFQFTQAAISITAGDTVTWTNTGGTHNVVADDGSFRSGDPATSFIFSHQFDTPGVFAYYCEVHGGPGGVGMSGTVTVTSTTVLTPTVYFPLITRS